jgi:hypothetical protein
MQRIYQKSRGRKKEKARRREPGQRKGISWMRSLAMIVVSVMVMVPISAMASCPRVFQITTAALRLAAVFTVLAFRIVQLLLRIADSLLAFPVVIAVKRSRGNGPAQERQNDKGRNECSCFFEHASSSGLHRHSTLDALRQAWHRESQDRASPPLVPDSFGSDECGIAV